MLKINKFSLKTDHLVEPELLSTQFLWIEFKASEAREESGIDQELASRKKDRTRLLIIIVHECMFGSGCILSTNDII